jgi:uncharacterized membrane protein
VTHALILLLALLIGVVAGLRSFTAPAVVSWAAYLGWIDLHGTWASWLANIITVIVFTVLAIGELVNDKLPKTPARTAPPIFAARLVMGGLAGAALGAWPHWTFTALGAGVIGAVLGTFGGYQAQAAGGGQRWTGSADRAARGCGRDLGRIRDRGGNGSRADGLPVICG